MGSFGTCYAPHIGAFWDTPRAKRPVFNTVIFGAGVASHWRDNIGITQSRHLLRIVEESKASHRGVGLLGRPGFFSSESTYKAPLEVGAPLRHSMPAYRPNLPRFRAKSPAIPHELLTPQTVGCAAFSVDQHIWP